MTTYAEAIALINAEPEATYIVKMDGAFYTFTGTVMRGFLCLSSGDTFDYFKRF